LTFDTLNDPRIGGAQIHIDEHSPFREIISWNPSGATVTPWRTGPSSPDRIEIDRLEKMHPFIVIEPKGGLELVSGLEHLVFHLKADRFSYIDVIRTLTVFRPDSDGSESSDLAARGLFSIQPFADGDASEA
jgi:hypothetical protein